MNVNSYFMSLFNVTVLRLNLLDDLVGHRLVLQTRRDFQDRLHSKTLDVFSDKSGKKSSPNPKDLPCFLVVKLCPVSHN